MYFIAFYKAKRESWPLTSKILLFMRITAVLLLVSLIQVSAATYSQNITINEKNADLEMVFKSIEHQTKLTFLYDKLLLKKSRLITVSLHNVSLETALQTCLKGQSLTFKIFENTIVIGKAADLNNIRDPLTAIVPVTVSGKVTDEKGITIPGASVTIKGTKTTTQTDLNGNFKIIVSDKNAILTITYMGFEPKEIIVGEQKIITVMLLPSSQKLNEVVISGYTSQSKAEFTGAASQITSADIADKPVQSFVQALAGQAAGVNVIQPSGVLNNPPVFRIRGFNSISLSSYPLIIVDGIALFTSNVGSFAPNNPLADINPADIETMDILKDASATAIYGSRAANGVVIITTKKGKNGATKVNYDGWIGLTSNYNLPEVLNAAEYVTIKNEALINGGSNPAYNLQTLSDGSTVDTRWYDYAYHTGISHNHNMSISGGTEKTSYFVSLGYTNQQGIIVKNTFDRKVGRVNIDHKLSSKIAFGTNFSYSNSMNRSPSTGSLSGQSAQLTGLAREAMVLPPNLSPYNEDGSYNIVGNSIGYGANTILTGYYNPLVLLDLDKYSSESSALVANVYAEYKLLKQLKFKTSYSMNKSNIENLNFTNPVQGYPGYDSRGSAINATLRNNRTDWTNTLNYTPSIGKNHINFLAGYEEIHTTSDSWGATRTGLTDNYYTTFQGGYSIIVPSGNAMGENGFRSYFSSLNYDFDQKYLLSGSFRRDGYSGLSAENKFGNFAGGSVGWNISKEDFFMNSGISKLISALKIRGSYGQVGNLNIGDYPALSLYNSGLYGTIATLAFSQAGNADLKWETSKKFDVGFNISLLNNRITIDADYYNNNIDGMILNAAQAASKGIPGNVITTNIGSMYNRGVEFSVDAKILDQGKFKWSSNFNISTLKNRITALANGADIYGTGLDPSNITRVGYSLGSIYVVKTTGVNPDNGQRMYLNRNGATVQYNYAAAQKWTYLDGSAAPAMDAKADGTVLGPSIPTYYGGFNNTFNYNAFDASINIGFSGGNKLYNGTKTTLMDQRFYNNSVEILDRWTTPGQITDVPRVVYNDNFSSGSSLANSASVEDGSFIKLRSAALGYRVSRSVLNKLNIASLRLYVQGSNLFTITKYTGTDPEVSSNGDSNSAPGVEKNSSPQARSFTLGLNIGF